MESNTLRNYIMLNKEHEITELLNSGLDPNLEQGWPIRLAARLGHYLIVKSFLRFGADPHLLSEAGASTLQLAVYSGTNWSDDKWDFLLSYCDSSQLADGAAVALIFQNILAFQKILATNRCNTHLPTTLTGKTIEQLAKGYKLQYLLTSQTDMNLQTQNHTPRRPRQTQAEHRSLLSPCPRPSDRNLSPSVARFFNQTEGQTSLTSPGRCPIVMMSPN